MTWEELKENFENCRVVKIPCKSLSYGFRNSDKEVEAIAFRNLFFTEEGDILFKSDDTANFVKIKHVPFCKGNEKYRLKEGTTYPIDADIWEPALSQKKCAFFEGAEWLEKYSISPTIKITIE